LQKLKDRFSGNTTHDGLQALHNYNDETDGKPGLPAGVKNDRTTYEPDKGLPNRQEELKPPTPLDIISMKIKVVIKRAADKPFAPDELIPQLQLILQEPQTFSDAEKAAISHLIVAECENTGTALLTEEEVDAWWEG